MATRAMISVARREEGVSFSEIPDKTVVEIYHHWDGYPEGLGVKLASYLDDKSIVNGIGSKDNEDFIFNGLGCMAASIVAQLKDGPGNVYIEPRDSHAWIDYEYFIWGDTDKEIWISIFSDSECIFVGKPKQLIEKYHEKYT